VQDDIKIADGDAHGFGALISISVFDQAHAQGLCIPRI